MIQVLFRRDHDYEWERRNPILKENELVVVYTATGTLYKKGDGKTPFNNLKYINNIASLGKVQIRGAGGWICELQFTPEEDKYRKTRDPYGVYTVKVD